MGNSDCTILVCSCDNYEDAWYPFFTLLKKNWVDCPYNILLNTESKSYVFDGLNIRCLQSNHKNLPYGARMIEHLKAIDTPFTLVLMDDFFIRNPVNGEEIKRVISFLKSDERAVVFNFQSIDDNMNSISLVYNGYEKRPIYGEYKYNFQAAVWKTKYLLSSWRSHEFPWEWETRGNFRSFNSKYDFYTLCKNEITPIDYGFKLSGMGIYRGKWVIDSVDKLFADNNINIDFNIRGIYSPEDKVNKRMQKENRLLREINTARSDGIFMYLHIFIWIPSPGRFH